MILPTIRNLQHRHQQSREKERGFLVNHVCKISFRTRTRRESHFHVRFGCGVIVTHRMMVVRRIGCDVFRRTQLVDDSRTEFKPSTFTHFWIRALFYQFLLLVYSILFCILLVCRFKLDFIKDLNNITMLNNKVNNNSVTVQ